MGSRPTYWVVQRHQDLETLEKTEYSVIVRIFESIQGIWESNISILSVRERVQYWNDSNAEYPLPNLYLRCDYKPAIALAPLDYMIPLHPIYCTAAVQSEIGDVFSSMGLGHEGLHV